MAVTRSDDGPHAGAAVEEWVFAAWTADATVGLLSGHRVLGRNAWYWACLATDGQPMLHVAEDNTTAIHLYQNLGFKQRSRFTFGLLQATA